MTFLSACLHLECLYALLLLHCDEGGEEGRLVGQRDEEAKREPGEQKDHTIPDTQY